MDSKAENGKLKVLWVTGHSCSGGQRHGKLRGTGTWMAELEKAVRNDICLEIAFLSPGKENEEFDYEGVHYRSISPFRSKNYLLFRLKRLLMSWRRQDSIILKRLEEIIHDSSPDIIHIHGVEKCFGLITDVAGDGYSHVMADGKVIPVVISIQGVMNAIVGKYFSGVPRRDVRRYTSLGCRLRKQSPMRMYRLLTHQAGNESRILSRAGYIIGRTEWDKEISGLANPLRKYFHVGEIMREAFYPRSKDGTAGRGKAGLEMKNGKPLRIVSTFSDGIYKGYELLLKVADYLSSRGFAFEWRVIGYESKSETVCICEKSTGLDSSKLNVSFTGRLDAEGMVEEMASADLFCQVSHIENSPNSLCEAMLMGLPCIATDVGGTATIAQNGSAALLVPDTDPAAYAEKIISLSGDTSAMAALGQRGQISALAHHDPQTVKDELLGIYKSFKPFQF